jgi:hypothetical protein
MELSKTGITHFNKAIKSIAVMSLLFISFDNIEVYMHKNLPCIVMWYDFYPMSWRVFWTIPESWWGDRKYTYNSLDKNHITKHERFLFITSFTVILFIPVFCLLLRHTIKLCNFTVRHFVNKLHKIDVCNVTWWCNQQTGFFFTPCMA